MATLGRSGDAALAERFASALAKEVKAVGFNLDFAPVLDVHTNAANPVIGDRALSERADEVGRLGAAIVRALQAEGVGACGKHFPGHGDTATDSHHELPVLEHPPDRLEAVEFVPFRAAVEAGVASIMTAHVLIPSLDAERPATLSPGILSRLRQGMAFDGLIISDDLDMKAVAGTHAQEEAIVLAIAAGCDLVLLCGADVQRHVPALEALIHAVEDGTLPEKRVEDALARQRRVKERFLATQMGKRPSPLTWQAIVGSDAHQAIAAEMARFV
jgi:beta-N-acetylhexosaminidase